MFLSYEIVPYSFVVCSCCLGFVLVCSCIDVEAVAEVVAGATPGGCEEWEDPFSLVAGLFLNYSELGAFG